MTSLYTRRAALATTARAFALVAGGKLLRASANVRTVVVIGAGMAGLAAARTLRDHGYTVQILEARARLGGRVWTSSVWPTLRVDLGASWIHGISGNPLTELAHQAGLTLYPTDYNNDVTYGADGRVYAAPRLASLTARYDRLMRAVESLRQRMQDANEADISLGRAIESVIAGWRLSAQQRAEVEYLLTVVIEHETAGAIDDLSLYNWDQDSAFDGGDVLLGGGYDALPHHVAGGLPIHYRTVVHGVRYTAREVTVASTRGAFHADCAVVTAPLGVLRSGALQFAPPLPEHKRHALRYLHMGVLDKLYLRFPRVFWYADATLLEHISLPHGQWCEWLNLASVLNAPVLLGFNAAPYAPRLERASDRQVVAGAMTVLRTIYGAAIPEPVGYQVTRWGTDPYARGSYSHIAPGGSGADYDALAAPLGRTLFFAGEATHRQYPGTVHGAYLSGLRAAQQVLDLDRSREIKRPAPHR